MPRKSLPDHIEPDPDASLTDATQGQLDVIRVLPQLWERHETIPEIADQTEWSASHVGNVWRTYFRESDQPSTGFDLAPKSHAETDAPQSGDAGGSVDSKVVHIRVDQIPDNDREALAFLQGVRASAN